MVADLEDACPHVVVDVALDEGVEAELGELAVEAGGEPEQHEGRQRVRRRRQQRCDDRERRHPGRQALGLRAAATVPMPGPPHCRHRRHR